METPQQKPSVGRIVLYTLTEENAAQINRRRTNSQSIADRIKASLWPIGAQAHIGNEAYAGRQYPMIITVVHSETTVNGQVFLDGNDTLWALSSTLGDQLGNWNWPPRV